MAHFNVEWTGDSVRGSGLLNQDYHDRAEVRDESDTLIGEILLLPSGLYRPTVSQIRGDDLPTMHQAARAVVDLYREFKEPFISKV